MYQPAILFMKQHGTCLSSRIIFDVFLKIDMRAVLYNSLALGEHDSAQEHDRSVITFF